MGEILQFIADPHNDFIGHTIAYIQICAFSIVVSVIIGVILGIIVSRNAVLGFIAVNLSGLMRAIPIIAFLIAVLPYLGLGFTPTVVALIILGIPPVLLNTYTGLRGIDPATIDAARGMGMTRGQIITRIQIPLVSPIVAAGIRTAAVQIVATATLAAFIGAGGYGDYIVDGLYKLNNAEMLAGAIPVAILAIIIEVFMAWLQRVLTPAGIRVQGEVEIAQI
ncbi:ABC transporter permease [Ktedonosporobacter rubrisoli]|uniref:ABC transporter permease n=1 Tax=Ktedonosporobacter rubrisoli TaxID=2509675 RepID=A0A4V0Z021_KTERU|nr:ABC transporter permease [Ktedonosporobacter rubrisoli]QBD81701.1 ABC transporter permease [Ktedonosporobacter rubrisoli]